MKEKREKDEKKVQFGWKTSINTMQIHSKRVSGSTDQLFQQLRENMPAHPPQKKHYNDI